MASTTRFTPRGVLVWGAVVIALVFGVALATTALGSATKVAGGIFGPPAPPIITQHVVVERLQSVAKLVADAAMSVTYRRVTPQSGPCPALGMVVA